MLGACRRAARLALSAQRANTHASLAAPCKSAGYAPDSVALRQTQDRFAQNLRSRTPFPAPVSAARIVGYTPGTVINLAPPGVFGFACGLRLAQSAFARARCTIPSNPLTPGGVLRRAFSDTASGGKASTGASANKFALPKFTLPKIPSFPKVPTLPKTPSRAEVKRAINGRIEAWWLANSRYVYVTAGFVGVFVVWRGVFYVASRSMNMTENLAEWGFLAFAIALVLMGAMYSSYRRTIHPDEVYKHAMRQVRSSAEVASALGRPLQETELRAFVMSGGRLRIKNFMPGYSTRRCHLLFPVQGSEGRGLVSVEAKKVQGKYKFKLIAVDAPGLGPSKRIYLAGDADEYNKGSILSELRDPLLNTLHSERVFEGDEDREALNPDESAASETSVSTQDSSAADVSGTTKRSPPQVDDGLYFYELVLQMFRSPKVVAGSGGQQQDMAPSVQGGGSEKTQSK